MSDRSSERIGPYEIRGVLGHGGMAIVYRAFDTMLAREVALKVLSPRTGTSDQLRERFRREARAVARLRHPNILGIYSFGEDHDIPYLVMELIEGGTLTRWLGQPVQLQEALALVRQIGNALDYAHRLGLVHRDVKPANIFLDGNRAVLADFGIVKAIEDEPGTQLTATGVGVGTPEYIAPEQALHGPIDGRADLYALGVVLYELLTGTVPFTGAPIDVLQQHVNGEIPDPRLRNPALPPAIADVMRRALARQPDDRYPTGAAFADAFATALRSTAGQIDSPADRDRRTLLLDTPPPALDDTRPGTLFGQLPALSRDTLSQSPPIDPAPLPALTQLPSLPDLSATGEPTVAASPPLWETTGQPQSPATPLPLVPRTPLVTAMPQPTPPTTQPDSYPVPVQPARGANWALWGTLAGVVLLSILVVGVASWFVLANRTSPTPTVAPTAVAQQTPTPQVTPSVNTVGAAASATTAFTNDPARSAIEAGERALREGKFSEAIASYRQALAQNPNSAIANRQLGLALWISSQERGDVDALDRATKLAPDDALAWAYLSFATVDAHQPGRAFDAAQRAIRSNAAQPEAHAALANAYLAYPPNLADPDDSSRRAQAAFNTAKALDPNNLWVLWVEQAILFDQKQSDAALAPLNRMIDQRPNWATLYYARGNILRVLNRPDEARAEQERALKIAPEYPYALMELGWLDYDKDNYQQARAYFEQALRLTEEINVSAHVGLGLTLLALGETTGGEQQCQRAITIDPRSPLGYDCLGYIYREGPRRYDDALVNFRKEIELRPAWEDGYIGVARVQAAQGSNYAAAEATLREALPRVKEPRAIHFWLGWTLFQQQKYSDAQPSFDEAAKALPKSAAFHFWRGSNLEHLGRYAEARAAYEQALTIDPEYEAAKDAIDRLNRQGR